MAKPDLSDPITLRLPVDVLKDVETIASACERTRSWVIVRALRHYLEMEGKDILMFLQGKAELEAGLGEDMEDVLREMEDILNGKAA